MTKWQKDKMTKWQKDKMTKRQKNNQSTKTAVYNTASPYSFAVFFFLVLGVLTYGEGGGGRPGWDKRPNFSTDPI